MCFSPRPSMSKALRETKCLRRSTRCAGQISPPVQRLTTSSLPVLGLISRVAWLPQAGQTCGKLESFRALRPLVLNHAENLRDDVAGALHDHRVADADVLAGDLVLVMQRRVLHHHAADRDRIELGDRRERAGAADLDVDVAQDRGRLLGGEFMGDGEARRARHEAEPLLEVEPVELIDDAVDIVVEARPAALDIAIGFKHFLDRVGQPDERVQAGSPRPARSDRRPIGSRPAGRPPRPSHRRRSAAAAWR